MLIVPAPRKNSPNLIEEMRANGMPDFDENSYVPLVFNDAPGLVLSWSFGLSQCDIEEEIVDRYQWKHEFPGIADRLFKRPRKADIVYGSGSNISIHAYGMCDNSDQIMHIVGKVLEQDHRKWVVSVHPIFRGHEPEHDGFRFDKWGPYVGTRKLTHDYLYDCTDIEYMCTWHIYQII